MSRTNIDDEACAAVVRRHPLTSKRDAVNTALRVAAVEPMSLDQALAMRGSGWEGDLEAMRESRTW